jgi:hypothetical protein
MANMNPLGWLNCKDPLERAVMEVISNERLKTAEAERQDLADRIINALGKAMKK